VHILKFFEKKHASIVIFDTCEMIKRLINGVDY